MFLPITKKEVVDGLDFVMISSDAYVDHPTYGHAIISRLIESEGFTIGIIPQPVCDAEYFNLPVPKIAYLISGGVVDSMVNNYTVAKKKRDGDVYSPLSKQGKRPDRQVTVYANTLKRLFPDSYVIIGGVEPSLRRFAHYDYWADTVMQSQLIDSKADLLIYGAGEKPFWDILALVKKGVPINKITDVRGTVYKTTLENKSALLEKGYIELPSYSAVCSDKLEYAKAFRQQARNTDSHNASVIFQEQKNGEIVVQNLPQFPLTEKEMDFIYNLPYERRCHPVYEKEGGIKSIEEVKFSVVSHRGCYGSCSFCSINYHQGRVIQKRSDDNILAEIKLLTKDKDFKGYIHDLSGPSANFREPACDKQKCKGVCKDRYCIGNKPCPNLKVDHSGFIALLRKARAVEGVKKVFIRSGIRYDYLLYEKDPSVMEEIVKHHVSGQLKVAPEHMSDNVLKVMNKPSFSVYKAFNERYKKINEKLGKKQFLVPYLISSHPGCALKDAVELTEYLKSVKYMPEQVQDFYPTPSTRSTCMYYTGIDPDTLKPVYVPKERSEKQLQRALLQYRLPKNKDLVNKAYALCAVEKLQNGHNKKEESKLKPTKKFIRGTEVYKKGLSSNKNGGKKKR
ncbi:MAG: YgiQ family radical SAM protein [Clostridia bacterium]|nr:YgiQ family radical SAM protein [Clostridia bacterium]